MKKAYMKPAIEVEAYSLSESIALNCGRVVTFGPGTDPLGSDACKEFPSWGDFGTLSISSNGTSFYEDGTANCTCYYTSGGQGYFTS